MSNNISIPVKSRQFDILGKVPWTLVIIFYMIVVHFTGLDMSGVAGYIFLGLCMAVLFVEFFKSGNINAIAFLIDLSSAVFALILATALMCYMIWQLEQTPTFFHWFGCIVILADAILSPFNAFRTALRNLGLGVSV